MKKTIHSVENRALTAWLRESREKRGMSMRTLAELLNVPHSWVGKIELGERRLDVIEYTQLCDALDVDPHVGIDKVINAIGSL